jgi:general secretion pathway protein K
VRRREAGFALVPVLWAAALLGLIAGAVAMAMRAETGIARAQRAAAEGRAIADAAIHLTIAQLLGADAAQRPRLDGTPFGLLLDDQAVLLRVQDEAGKVDLNMAVAEVLRRYFAVMLVDEADTAEALAPAVLARRWPAPGARRFLGVAELGLLPGVTPAMLARVAPGLTVHAQQPGPDPATAVPAALLALPGMTAAEVERVLALRSAAAGGPAREIMGTAVELRAELERGGLWVRRRAVVRLVADPARPVWVYAWE